MYKVTLQSNTLVPLPAAATLIAGGVSTLKAMAGGGGVCPQRRVRSTRKQRETHKNTDVWVPTSTQFVIQQRFSRECTETPFKAPHVHTPAHALTHF